MAQNDHETVDMLLVGAGIMSATLAVLLKELDPNLKMEVVELQESGAIESSNPWNNAGTGHAGLCELNYTPQSADGSIDIKKAVGINTMFEVSKQFWSHLVAKGTFGSPKTFINPVPHLSFVRGSEGIAYLKKRFESLTKHHAFETMVYSEDKATLAEWMPLMMPGRPADEAIAATRVEGGTDVNFGALTNQLLQHLAQQPGAQIRYNQKVTHLRRADNGWRVTVKDTRNGGDREIQARFVFLGAGGGALPLLQLSGIPEGKGFGGFPVSGQWLRCDNPEIVKQHQAKVYSQAEVGSPPMSVPHLDTRVVDGKKSLLFGPYAGFSTKFLRHGSFLDLPLSVRPGNILPMLSVARDNMDLTRYLIGQVMQSPEQRLEALRKFYPEARGRGLAPGSRRPARADHQEGSEERRHPAVRHRAGGRPRRLHRRPAGRLAGRLGDRLDHARPDRALLPEQARSPEWSAKLKEIFPAREKELESDAELYRSVSSRCSEVLELTAKNDVQAPVNAE